MDCRGRRKAMLKRLMVIVEESKMELSVWWGSAFLGKGLVKASEGILRTT